MRRDLETVSLALNSDPERWLLQFLGLIQDNALAGFVSGVLFELRLAPAAGAVCLRKAVSEQSRDGVWFENSLMTNLRRTAGVELTRFDDFDDKFVKLLDCLQPMQSDLIWLVKVSRLLALFTVSRFIALVVTLIA